MVDLLSDKVEENLALARDVQSKLKEVRRAMVDSLRLIDESIQRAPNGPGELGFDLSREADGSTWAVFPNGQRVLLEPAGGGDERAAEGLAEEDEAIDIPIGIMQGVMVDVSAESPTTPTESPPAPTDPTEEETDPL